MKLGQIESQIDQGIQRSANHTNDNVSNSVSQSALKMLLLVTSDPNIHADSLEISGDSNQTAASRMVLDGAVVPLLQLCKSKIKDNSVAEVECDEQERASTTTGDNPQEADSDSDRTPPKSQLEAVESESESISLADSLVAHLQGLPSHLTGARRPEPESASVSISFSHSNKKEGSLNIR